MNMTEIDIANTHKATLAELTPLPSLHKHFCYSYVAENGSEIWRRNFHTEWYVRDWGIDVTFVHERRRGHLLDFLCADCDEECECRDHVLKSDVVQQMTEWTAVFTPAGIEDIISFVAPIHQTRVISRFGLLPAVEPEYLDVGIDDDEDDEEGGWVEDLTETGTVEPNPGPPYFLTHMKQAWSYSQKHGRKYLPIIGDMTNTASHPLGHHVRTDVLLRYPRVCLTDIDVSLIPDADWRKFGVLLFVLKKDYDDFLRDFPTKIEGKHVIVAESCPANYTSIVDKLFKNFRGKYVLASTADDEPGQDDDQDQSGAGPGPQTIAANQSGAGLGPQTSAANTPIVANLPIIMPTPIASPPLKGKPGKMFGPLRPANREERAAQRALLEDEEIGRLQTERREQEDLRSLRAEMNLGLEEFAVQEQARQFVEFDLEQNCREQIRDEEARLWRDFSHQIIVFGRSSSMVLNKLLQDPPDIMYTNEIVKNDGSGTLVEWKYCTVENIGPTWKEEYYRQGFDCAMKPVDFYFGNTTHPGLMYKMQTSALPYYAPKKFVLPVLAYNFSDFASPEVLLNWPHLHQYVPNPAGMEGNLTPCLRFAKQVHFVDDAIAYGKWSCVSEEGTFELENSHFVQDGDKIMVSKIQEIKIHAVSKKKVTKVLDRIKAAWVLGPKKAIVWKYMGWTLPDHWDVEKLGSTYCGRKDELHEKFTFEDKAVTAALSTMTAIVNVGDTVEAKKANFMALTSVSVSLAKVYGVDYREIDSALPALFAVSHSRKKYIQSIAFGNPTGQADFVSV